MEMTYFLHVHNVTLRFPKKKNPPYFHSIYNALTRHMKPSTETKTTEQWPEGNKNLNFLFLNYCTIKSFQCLTEVVKEDGTLPTDIMLLSHSSTNDNVVYRLKRKTGKPCNK